jgi:DNA-binding CsgD family transcriptional regulator
MKTDPTTAANTFMRLFSRPDDHLKSFKTEDDEDIIFNHLRFTEQIFPKHGIMVCPVSHTKTKFLSATCENIMGYSYAELWKMGLPDFFARIHPDDLQPVQQCLSFMKSIKPFDPADYRFLTYYRFQNKSGEYFYLLDEKVSIRTPHGTYIHLLLFSHATTENKFHRVKMEVQKNMKGSFINVYTYNPKQDEQSITPRQNDIVNLIAKGFTNQEIADHLNVSVYTVKNHKQSLFKRIKVRNSIELASYIRRQKQSVEE